MTRIQESKSFSVFDRSWSTKENKNKKSISNASRLSINSMPSLWNLVLADLAERMMLPLIIYQSTLDSHLPPLHLIDQSQVKVQNQFKSKLNATTPEKESGCQKSAILNKISYKDLHISSQPTMPQNWGRQLTLRTSSMLRLKTTRMIQERILKNLTQITPKWQRSHLWVPSNRALMKLWISSTN